MVKNKQHLNKNLLRSTRIKATFDDTMANLQALTLNIKKKPYNLTDAELQQYIKQGNNQYRLCNDVMEVASCGNENDDPDTLENIYFTRWKNAGGQCTAENTNKYAKRCSSGCENLARKCL